MLSRTKYFTYKNNCCTALQSSYYVTINSNKPKTRPQSCHNNIFTFTETHTVQIARKQKKEKNYKINDKSQIVTT